MVAAVQQLESTSELRLGATSRSGAVFELTAGRFALLFGLLIFAAFPQVILGLQTFVVRDFGFFSYPVAHYQRECFWRGELPLWNPYSYCGVPFLAQWNTMVLYPPALIYLLLPLNWSLSFFCLLHLFWAGLGMYFLARRWTGNLLAAGLAGVVFGFNGFSLNLLMWPSHIATFSWMPWVVLAAESAWKEGGRKLVIAGLIGALQMLAGGPETIFFTWAMCGVFWVGHMVTMRTARGKGEIVRVLWRLPLLAVLVALLAAVQLLPFLDLAAHSQRETGYADARWSMPARGWANFMVPMAFGSTVKQGLFFQQGQYWTSSYYLGVGALLLAGVAILSIRNARVWLLLGGSVVCLLVATGDQTAVSRFARRVLPQLTMITYPVKFVIPVVFAGPLLAAFGLTWLHDSDNASARKRLLWTAAALGTGIVLVLLWTWRFPLAPGEMQPVLLNGLGRIALLAVLVSALGIMLSGRRLSFHGFTSVPGLAPVLLLVTAWFDIWTHEPQQNPTVQPWVYQPNLARMQLALNPQPSIGSSRVMVSPAAQQTFVHRVLDDPVKNLVAKRLGFFADCNLLDLVPKVDGFFSLCPGHCGELNSAVYVSEAGYGEGLLDFLSVSHLTTEGESVKWTVRTNYLPLATAGQQPVFVDDTNALRSILNASFDPRQAVYLPLQEKPFVLGHSPASVTLNRVSAHEVDMSVEAAGNSVVVLGQTYYHRWSARVDGNQTRLMRANCAFQAVVVPGGKHSVRITYEDRLFRAGAVISGLSLACCFSMLCGYGWKRRQRSGPNSAP